MKITKERLIEIIKEELQNTQNTNEAADASDEEEFAAQDAARAEKSRELEKLYFVKYEKDENGRYQRVYGPAYQEMVKDLENLGRPDVIDRLPILYSISITNMKEVHDLAKAGDMEGLDKMVGSAKSFGDAVIRSGPLGT